MRIAGAKIWLVSMFALNEIIEFAPKTGKAKDILKLKSRAPKQARSS
jgi:hypothetical protein